MATTLYHSASSATPLSRRVDRSVRSKSVVLSSMMPRFRLPRLTGTGDVKEIVDEDGNRRNLWPKGKEPDLERANSRTGIPRINTSSTPHATGPAAADPYRDYDDLFDPTIDGTDGNDSEGMFRQLSHEEDDVAQRAQQFNLVLQDRDGQPQHSDKRRSLRPKIRIRIPEGKSQTPVLVQKEGAAFFDDKTLRALEGDRSPPSMVSAVVSLDTAANLELLSPVSPSSPFSPDIWLPSPTSNPFPYSLLGEKETKVHTNIHEPRLSVSKTLLDHRTSDPSTSNGSARDDDASTYSSRSSMSSLISDGALDGASKGHKEESKPSFLPRPRLGQPANKLFSILSPIEAGVFDQETLLNPPPRPHLAPKDSPSALPTLSPLSLPVVKDKPLPVVPAKIEESAPATLRPPSQPKANTRPITPKASSSTTKSTDSRGRSYLEFNGDSDSKEARSRSRSPMCPSNKSRATVDVSGSGTKSRFRVDDLSPIPPLQISRGPMSMVPRREAPSPPAELDGGPPLDEIFFGAADVLKAPSSDINMGKSSASRYTAPPRKKRWVTRFNKDTADLALNAMGGQPEDESREISKFSPNTPHQKRSRIMLVKRPSTNFLSLKASRRREGKVRPVAMPQIEQRCEPVTSPNGASFEMHPGTCVLRDLPETTRFLSPPKSEKFLSFISEADVDYEDPHDNQESLFLSILLKCDNLQDLFSTAKANKGFYRTFKRRELALIKKTLFKMSPPAWELREICPPYTSDEEEDQPDSAAPVPDYTAESYIRRYSKDMYIIVVLKSLIFEHCKSFLRHETLHGIQGDGPRSAEIDNALWRICTFCKIFGSKKGREEDLAGQMDWLTGGYGAREQLRPQNVIFTGALCESSVLLNPPECFGQGNAGGLSAEEVYDMIEVWICLGVLLRGFHLRRHEARDFGVFEGHDVKPGDVLREHDMLEEWTSYLLTLGPATVLTLVHTEISLPTETTFARARSAGLTHWPSPPPGTSRSTFFKEAAYRVYKEKTSERLKKAETELEASFNSAPMHPDSPTRQRQRHLASEIKRLKSAKHQQQQRLRPIENRDFKAFSFVESTTGMITPPTSPSPPRPKTPPRNPRRQTIQPPPLGIKELEGSPSEHQSATIRIQREDKSTEVITNHLVPAPLIPSIKVNGSTPSPPPEPQPQPMSTQPPNPPPYQRQRFYAQAYPNHSRTKSATKPALPKPFAPNSTTATTHVKSFHRPNPGPVTDPVDKARSWLVDRLGYSVADATEALRVTDTGERIDIEAAIKMLQLRRVKRERRGIASGF